MLLIRIHNICTCRLFKSVLWIRDILVRIRIRGYGSCFFLFVADKLPTKICFFQSFFSYYFLKVNLHQFLKVSQKDVTK